jgi:hypothetical protein
VCFESSGVDVALKGLSLFDCSSEYGALCDWKARAVTSRSNLTSLKGDWSKYTPVTPAIYQYGSGVSIIGSFLLFANGSGGYGCFVNEEGSAVFRQCLFVGNSVGAIAHLEGATNQTRLESCYFVNTKLRRDVFAAGSVLVDSCLFAGEVQSAEGFKATGVQISFTSTEISFDTASLLPLCDQYGKFHTPRGTETPEGTDAPATREGHEGGNVLATRKARIIPFVVLQLALLALGFTL